MRFAAATERDRQLVEGQLGRPARGLVGVARRCASGCPQVIVNAPLLEHDGEVEVFPTVFWLSCPYLARAVSRLEAAGWVKRIERRVEEEPAFCVALERAQSSHARLRTALAPRGLLEALRRRYPERWAVVTKSGVGGTRNLHAVKCLHAHLADFLARGENPVGQVVRDKLVEQGVELDGGGRCREVCMPAWRRVPQREEEEP